MSELPEDLLAPTPASNEDGQSRDKPSQPPQQQSAQSSMMILGYAMRAASEGIPGVIKPSPQEPVVILLDVNAGVFWLNQSSLSSNIETIEQGLKKNPDNPFGVANRNLYREALEGLQERIKDKYDFGKPLQSPRDFIQPKEKPAPVPPGTRVAELEVDELNRMYSLESPVETPSPVPVIAARI